MAVRLVIGIAKLSTTGTGAADATWNPDANNVVNTITFSGSNLFVGGSFLSIGGQTRNRIAKLSTTGTGAADATWNPNADGTVNSLAISGTELYVGGEFNNIGGQTRVRIANLSTTGTGAANTWSVSSTIQNNVTTVFLSNSGLYVGGIFTQIFAGVNYFAIFSTPPAISTSGTITAMSTTLGTASNPSNFNVSGTNLNVGITISVPNEFEVSLDANSGYAGSIVLGSAGNIPSTPVFIRLKVSNPIGTYAGVVNLSSTGASSVQVTIPNSTVSPAASEPPPTSLYDEFGKINVNLYPNPTQEHFSIELPSVQKVEVRILDIQGKVLESNYYEYKNINVSLATRGQGVYFVEIISKEGSLVKRLIKM